MAVAAIIGSVLSGLASMAGPVASIVTANKQQAALEKSQQAAVEAAVKQSNLESSVNGLLMSRGLSPVFVSSGGDVLKPSVKIGLAVGVGMCFFFLFLRRK
jgi:NADPH:quinone reductase-like Zn-dependent oxidoreductase